MVHRQLTTKDCILSKSVVAICRVIETFGGSVRRWCTMARKHAYTLSNVDSSPSRYVRHAQIVLKRTSSTTRPFQKVASKMTSRSLGAKSMLSSLDKISVGSWQIIARTRLRRLAASHMVPQRVLVNRISTSVWSYFSLDILLNSYWIRCVFRIVLTKNTMCLTMFFMPGNSLTRSMHMLCSACNAQPNAKTNSSSWMHRRRSFTMTDGKSEQKLNIGALTKCLLRVATSTLSSESKSPVKSRAG